MPRWTPSRHALPLVVLVVRSAISTGFCGGLCPVARISLSHSADRAAFAWYGQWVFRKLASLDSVSVAYIDGPCLGAGFEVALGVRSSILRGTSNDAISDSRSGSPASAAHRESASLPGDAGQELIESGRIISGREARRLGLVDVVCSERRAKIEFRPLLDRLRNARSNLVAEL